MPTHKTKGIIIRRDDLGEADKILTIFTPNMGKIKAVARGVKKTTSKLGGHLELFCSVDLILAKGRNLDIVTAVARNYHFKNLCFNLKRVVQAYYICELIDKFTSEDFKDTRLFNLIFFALDSINREVSLDGKMDLILSGFKIKMLEILGYKPEMSKCVKCGKKLLNNHKLYFSNFLGGVIGEDCFSFDRLSKIISSDCLKVLKYLEINNFDEIRKLCLDKKLILEVEGILDFFIRFILDKEFKSVELIANLHKFSTNRTNT